MYTGVLMMFMGIFFHFWAPHMRRVADYCFLVGMGAAWAMLMIKVIP
jgi:hypothetical protein